MNLKIKTDGNFILSRESYFNFGCTVSVLSIVSLRQDFSSLQPVLFTGCIIDQFGPAFTESELFYAGSEQQYVFIN